MADRLDFASVAVGGAEGPATPEGQPAYAAAPGGDAAELLAVACGTGEPEVAATTVEDAVRIGRAAMADDPSPGGRGLERTRARRVSLRERVRGWLRR